MVYIYRLFQFGYHSVYITNRCDDVVLNRSIEGKINSMLIWVDSVTLPTSRPSLTFNKSQHCALLVILTQMQKATNIECKNWKKRVKCMSYQRWGKTSKSNRTHPHKHTKILSLVFTFCWKEHQTQRYFIIQILYYYVGDTTVCWWRKYVTHIYQNITTKPIIFCI